VAAMNIKIDHGGHVSKCFQLIAYSYFQGRIQHPYTLHTTLSPS